MSRASRKTPVDDVTVEEEENRPFSQAHNDPITQVEIETDNTDNQNQSNANKTAEQNVTDDEKEVDTARDDKKDDEGPHYL